LPPDPVTGSRATQLNLDKTSRRRQWKSPAIVALAVLAGFGTFGFASGATASHGTGLARPEPRTTPYYERVLNKIGGSCPWTSPKAAALLTDSELARAIEKRMTLVEKARFVVLDNHAGYENVDAGIPRLCVPRLTLQDGPNGVAAEARGVTALPASIGIAASFDTKLAYQYGQVIGSEARRKGIDGVQGPNLNLLRVPESGRAFEGYGEDPFLVSQMGVADVEGIQSTGIMADVKHFTAYNQETARTLLDERISKRALEELYLAPFRAAVEDARVASIMCAYGSINGVNDCSDPFLYRTLYRQWGFEGFVRSDLRAVTNPVAAFRAGLSLIKPASPEAILSEVKGGALPIKALDLAVVRILTEMIRFGLIGQPRPQSLQLTAATPAHAAFALRAAEESMVLLKNHNGLLPLSRNRSIAVIGVDAATSVYSEGGGSSHVIGPFLSRPLDAIRAVARTVLFAPGGPTGGLSNIPLRDYREGSPLPERAQRPHESPNLGRAEYRILHARGITAAIATASAPQPRGSLWRTWHATVIAHKTGLYEISLMDDGDTWLSIDRRVVLAFRGLHPWVGWSTTYRIVAGRRYLFTLRWVQVGHLYPRIAWADVSPQIQQAVSLAKRMNTAVVFVDAPSGEGWDRPNLALPGDANALISAVARANRRTVVVLNTPGAVLMPWLKHVSAVLEAWYPGEQDGRATAAVLFGQVAPSGRLPMTFPATNSAVPTNSPSAWPGKDAVVEYREGLDIGYRYDQVHHLTPLFPFGYGLSYTSFSLSATSLRNVDGHDVISISVLNTGTRRGTEVVECYLAYPPGFGEAPLQLRGIATITIKPRVHRIVTIRLDRADFEAYLGRRFTVPPGTFTARIGTSSLDLPISLRVPVPS